jgi:hypothetical protein
MNNDREFTFRAVVIGLPWAIYRSIVKQQSAAGGSVADKL